MANFRLRQLRLWERGRDVICGRLQLSFGGGLEAWIKENPCLSLESKHDSSVLQLLAYGWTVLVGISFQPYGLHFFLLNYAKTPFKPKSITKFCDIPVSLLYYALINRQRTYEITAYYLKAEYQNTQKLRLCLFARVWNLISHPRQRIFI